MTTDQPSLLDQPPQPSGRDLTAARTARDLALERVDAAASVPWKDAAWEFLNEYLRSHSTMFVDDLWDAGLPHTREDRALGPLFNRAARAGLMRKSGTFRPSVRSHLTEKPVWLSLVYREVTERLS